MTGLIEWFDDRVSSAVPDALASATAGDEVADADINDALAIIVEGLFRSEVP